MNVRIGAVAIASGVALAVVLADLAARPSGACTAATASAECGPGAAAIGSPSATGPSPIASSDPSPSPVWTVGPSPTVAPAPTATAPPVVYTFDDEFDGSVLRGVWERHWPPFSLAQWSRSHATVANGVLTIRATKVGSSWVSSLIDTTGAFQQRYGTFSARIRAPQGSGLWPAFWLAQPPSPSHGLAEADVMELCANPPGDNGGNDVTQLHTIVHATSGQNVFGYGYRTTNLAEGWHVYSVDWQPGSMTFFLDGHQVSRFASPLVARVPMVVVLDLAVGSRWCGAPDASTAADAVMQVDWVRVTR